MSKFNRTTSKRTNVRSENEKENKPSTNAPFQSDATEVSNQTQFQSVRVCVSEWTNNKNWAKEMEVRKRMRERTHMRARLIPERRGAPKLNRERERNLRSQKTYWAYVMYFSLN